MKNSNRILALVISGFLASSVCAEELTLREQLMERASQSKIPADIREKGNRRLKELSESDLTEKALKVGDKAPDFTLKDHKGIEKRLQDYLADGPVIVTWYRGGW